MVLALAEGVVAQAACGLTNARASEPSSSIKKQFKENSGCPEGRFTLFSLESAKEGPWSNEGVIHCVAYPRDPTYFSCASNEC